MSITCGIDVGSSVVKIVIMENDLISGSGKMIFKDCRKIRSNDPKEIVNEIFYKAISESGLNKEQIEYIASTGEGYFVDFKTGHFYGMTTHARGAKYLCKNTKTVVDLGALHHRVMLIDERSKVLEYRMTGQCASCSGQFIENVSRYLGVGFEETGTLALNSKNPKPISGVCAVLAETDVVNMVSKEIALSDILMGVFNLMAERVVRMIGGLKAQSPITFTGGLANNEGMIIAMKNYLEKNNLVAEINYYEDSIYAGSIGAALLGALRLSKIIYKNV